MESRPHRPCDRLDRVGGEWCLPALNAEALQVSNRAPPEARLL